MVSISTLMALVMLSQAEVKPACSLTINVVDKSGRSVHAYVTVIEQSGRVIEKKHEPGGVRFCDLGFKPVRVEVRPISISCTWAFSDVVDVDWAEERSQTIVVHSGPCKYGPSANGLPDCNVLFRIKDEDGEWVGESKIVITPAKKTITPDRYGRALLKVPNGTLVSGEVIAQNYRDAQFQFTCTEARTEREIELIWIRQASPP